MFLPHDDRKLPNGAYILDRTYTGDTWVWLAYKAGDFMPFVTWVSNRDSPGDTYAGTYHMDLFSALDKYKERVAFNEVHIDF